MFKSIKKSFEGKTELQKLENQHSKLMEDCYRMSFIDVGRSDILLHLGNDIAEKINKLRSNERSNT